MLVVCVCVSYCKEAKHSLFLLYKHDMSHPICQHSFYRDPCGHKAVRHNYVCSEYTIYTLLISLISVTKCLLHSLYINLILPQAHHSNLLRFFVSRSSFLLVPFAVQFYQFQQSC